MKGFGRGELLRTQHFIIWPVLICFCIAANVGAQEYITAKAGAYGVAGTWTGGVVPPSGSNVKINHPVTAQSISVGANSTLVIAADGALDVGNAITISGGTLINDGGRITVGPAGGGNRILSLKGGTLKVTSGTITINGGLSLEAGKFMMKDGNLVIDPIGSHESLADGSDVFKVVADTVTEVTGG